MFFCFFLLPFKIISCVAVAKALDPLSILCSSGNTAGNNENTEEQQKPSGVCETESVCITLPLHSLELMYVWYSHNSN